jgi:hypothetical protein
MYINSVILILLLLLYVRIVGPNPIAAYCTEPYCAA